MNKKQIKFATKTQALLFELELKGQISDGYWENSKPYDHYRVICEAEVVVDPDQIGLNFYTSRSYNFANATLVECVGDRMQLYVLLSKKFPSLSNSSIKSCNSGKWMWETKVGEPVPEYKQTFYKEMADVCNVHSYKELQILLSTLDKNDYPLKELRKDLKVINHTFKVII
jgi:hypothetical protein